jgi:hypothetical protein
MFASYGSEEGRLLTGHFPTMPGPPGGGGGPCLGVKGVDGVTGEAIATPTVPKTTATNDSEIFILSELKCKKGNDRKCTQSVRKIDWDLAIDDAEGR